MASPPHNPVLILGAGVNGAALARELLLNGLPVCIVDRFDLAYGATSKSSRLIHGGLRYLEYGDVRLVRESLAERSRLLSLAPHRVRTLRLAIPVRKSFGGFLTAAARFIGCGRRRGLRWLGFLANRKTERGLWVVRVGLWLYDRFARDKRFPDHELQRSVGDSNTAGVDSSQYRWLCSYTDGQMPFPERFVVDLLRDAEEIAAERGLAFRLHTYSDVRITSCFAPRKDVEDVGPSNARLFAERKATITPLAGNAPPTTIHPAAVVNATGAWGDATLQQLGVESDRLFGGTKGSHFITYQPRLRESLGDGGVYAEAADGRLVFVLPYREGVLVGTTDERFEQQPQQAVASDAEIDYLLQLVNELFPGVELNRDDVGLHYSGVRPLPFVPEGKTSAISRDHHVQEHADAPLPTFTLVGGKLTTARAFAELAAEIVLQRVGVSYDLNTRERVLPGGEDYPESTDSVACRQSKLAEQFPLPTESIAAVWELFGTCTQRVLRECGNLDGSTIAGTSIPVAVVRWVVEHEWVTRLEDLVVRRLLLVDRPTFCRETLGALAKLLPGATGQQQIEAAVEDCVERLRDAYGVQI